MKRPQMILVLGMHRSGTSLVTNIIAKWGCNVGDELIIADNFNVKGYWEHRTLIALNQEILDYLGATWYLPPRLNQDPSILKDLDRTFGERAKAIINKFENQGFIYCLKDPRFTFLMDFWKQYIDEPNLIIVIVVRNPTNVAKSLYKRDGLPIELSNSLWEQTYLDIYKHTRQIKHKIIVNYDAIISDTSKEIKTLLKFLANVTGESKDDHILSEIIPVVSGHLSHYNEPFKPQNYSPLIVELYDSLKSKSFGTYGAAYDRNKNKQNGSTLIRILKDFKKAKVQNEIQNYNNLEAQLFIDTGKGFNEAESIKKPIKSDDETFYFTINKKTGIKGFRFDPCNKNTSVLINHITYYGSTNKSITDWDKLKSNCAFQLENFFIFDENDPIIILESTAIKKIDKIEIRVQYFNDAVKISEILQKIITDTKVRLTDNLQDHIIENDSLKRRLEKIKANEAKFVEKLHQQSLLLSEKKNILKDFQKKLDDKIKQIADLNNIIKLKTEDIEKGTKKLTKLSNEYKKLQKELRESKQKIKETNEKIVFLEKDKNNSKQLQAFYENLQLEKNATIEALILEKNEKGLSLKKLEQVIADQADIISKAEDKITDLTKYMSELKTSYSFRIGWLLTAPARLIYNLLHKKSSKNTKFRLWIKLIKVGFLKPFKTIKHLNYSNLKTLIYALKHENPETIFNNFNQLIINHHSHHNTNKTVKHINPNHSTGENYNNQQFDNQIKLLADSNLFNEQYYLENNPDVKNANISAAQHYLFQGWKEGRNPSPEFDTNYYLMNNKDVEDAQINPLIHYLSQGYLEGRNAFSNFQNEFINTNITINDLHDPYNKPNTQSEYENEETPNIIELKIKPIAFYLPQFHPFEENDKFWGKGFTEWTNTTKALPLFRGHYQPRLPGELGFYDLRIKEVMKRQIELAKKFGIFGFCFHHYFFEGKSLMREPLNHIMNNKDLDIPFCLHWANEPWTAKFDGGIERGAVLMEQRHSPEDDLAFFRDIEPVLHDPRYIQIEGRPLLLIYRPGLFPNFKKTVKLWKECCKKAGLKELFLVNLETGFEGRKMPAYWNCDASVEFLPHYARNIHYKDKIEFFTDSFEGKIFNFDDVVRGSIERTPPNYQLYRGIFPDWDNTARRKESTIYYKSTPQKYQLWLESLCRYTEKVFPEDKQFIFINAWNEWAEGAYLEPDRKYGYAYLNATARALLKFSKVKSGSGKILFVSHDAHLAGAQIVLLSMLKWLKKHTNIEIKILCIEGGEMLEKFKKIGDTMVLSRIENELKNIDLIVARLFEFCEGKPDLIYANSVGSGKAFPTLSKMNIPIITHVHELKNSIEVYAAHFIPDIIKMTTHFIACSNAVAENLIKNLKIPQKNVDVIYAFIDSGAHLQYTAKSKFNKRVSLGFDTNKLTVLGSGLGLFWRKGADLFIDTANHLYQSGFRNFHFYWLGEFSEPDSHIKFGTWKDCIKKVEEYGLSNYITFLGKKSNVFEYYAASDIFILPSREDPFPLVCLEAASCGLPVLCFANAGGMPDFVEEDAGFIVPFEDTETMASKILLLSKNPELQESLGKRAKEKFLLRHTTNIASPEILNVCRKIGKLNPKISIIVPNYNYDQYLEKRLDSIFNQTFKDFEVIILDDASSDKSQDIIKKYKTLPAVRVYSNKENSGSVFKQWIKGIKLAKGDIIWIAEADDYSDERFLETLLPLMNDKDIHISYCASHVVDDKNKLTKKFYTEVGYYNNLPNPSKWENDYISNGDDELNDGLIIKNTIPNASAVLMRKSEILKVDTNELFNFNCGGDWFIYINIVRNGKIAYSSKHLNYHRRHNLSVVSKNLNLPEDTIPDYYKIHEFAINNFTISNTTITEMIKSVEIDLKSIWPKISDKKFMNLYNIERLKDLHKKNS